MKIEPFFDVSAPQVIHQILDCIFMGPYARVDYWPMPACQAGEECLTGPYWSRDTGQGRSRSVDPYNCLTVNSLPFTCGSPGRQSLIRYFVNTYLSNANANTSVFQQSVLAQLREIKATWPSPNYTKYGCVCADKSQSHTCCADGTGPDRFFPPNLVLNTKDLSPDKVLNSIDLHFGQIYARALQTQGPWLDYLSQVAPGEFAKYDWTGSRRASDEARLNPKQPAYSYGSDEAMSPLGSVDSTLWDVCHASLKQVFWTLPIYAGNNTIVFGAQRADDGSIVSDPLSFDALPYDGDAGRLEDYIRALVSQAARESPLFRHYVPRHAPSPSLVCVPDPSAPPPAPVDDGTASYNDYVHQRLQPPHVPIMAGARLGTFPVYHYQRMSLGAAVCPCDWPMQDGLCAAPQRACASAQAVSARLDCLFHPANASTILEAFSPDWPCPEFELSAHWGLLDPAAAEQWLRGGTSLTADTQDLLQYGRAGVRAGGLDTIRRSAKTAINPTARRTGLERAQLTTCGAGERLMPARDLAERFVEQLFPMSQGVEEAGAASHCLRYTMEVALLEALTLATPETFDASAQAQVVARWRRRCGAQLQLLSLCVNLDVFRAPDPSISLFAATCMHFAPESAANFYVTPECLVFLDGAFYDPCRCMLCVGNSAFLDPAYLKSTPACRLRFDPRTIVRAAPVGWWPADSPGAAEANAHHLDPAMLLTAGLSQTLLDDPDAVGNTITGGASWWESEGPMNQTSQDCDMIADWWPDEWDYPVGYHVTVPCAAEDAAYRSFHQAFAYTGVDDARVPVLTYQHDMFRDGELVDSNFGVNGLCRSLNWGMDSFVTNTMRYCTRAPAGQYEDYTVFRGGPRQADTQAWTEWACSTSHTQLPWPDSSVTDSPNTNTAESNLYSLGTVPNLPPSGANYYPHDASTDTYDPGPWQDIIRQKGWGSGCSDFPLVFCATDSDCPDGAYPYHCRGRYCRGTLVKCKAHLDCNGTASKLCEGVCIDRTVACLSHAECPDGKMCTGLGECVKPVVSVQNKLSDKNFAFQVSARKGVCPAGSRNFSMLAGSYWAYVDNDVLRLHGLCSYGDWYKYQQTLSNPDCGVVDRGDYVEINPFKCPYIDLDALVPNVTRWWEFSAVRPQVMYMHPSNCDRDYERVQDAERDPFLSCAPVSASIRIALQDISSKITFDQYAKMHMGGTPSSGDVKIPLAKMPFRTDKRYGFLGIGQVASDESLTNVFQSCSNLDQCTVPPFTVRGRPATRMMFPFDSWVKKNYSANDVYKCGVVGYSEGSQCRLDLSVLQMYRFMCVEEAQVSRRCSPLVQDLPLLCSAVSNTYPAGYATVASNVDALNSILYSIPIPTDKDSYLNTMDCVQDLYAYMTDSKQLYAQLYWVFDFVLYEISFDWFYQCIVMNQHAIDASTTARRNQDCQPYRYASSYSVDGYTPRSSNGDTAMTMLRFVRGGYNRSYVNAYETQHYEEAKTKLETIKASLVQSIYGGTDTSYPRCSRNLRWKVGPNYRSEYLPELRHLINTLYFSGGCEGTWLTDQVKTLQSAGYQLTVDTWWQYMTDIDTQNLFMDGSWQYEKSLIELLESEILANMGARFSSKVMGLNENPSGLKFTTRSEAFVMNNLMNASYAGELYAGLDPSQSSLIQGREVDIDDTDIHHVCLFDNPLHDPLLQGIDLRTCSNQKVNKTDGLLQDELLVCTGPVYCTRTPVYYITDGAFLCQYYPDMPSSPCDGTLEGCGLNLLNALYDKFYSMYDPGAVPPLKPVLLPWMAPAATWGFSFDLTQVLDFLGNIMPNKEQSVMCTVKSEIVNLMNCTNPHYTTLKQHVQKHFMYNGSVIVPSDAQLDWTVDQAFLTAGGIFSFASTDRETSRTFLKGLFDDESVCKGETMGDQRVCWKASDASVYNSINPWLLGYWNPYVQCDVDYTGQTQAPLEFINAGCTDVICPKGGPYDTNMPLQAKCNAMLGQQVNKPGVPQIDMMGDYLPYNLCHHRLVEDQVGCLHDQALLGGYDGLPVSTGDDSVPMNRDTPYANYQYKVSKDMYTSSTWDIPDDFMGGLFDQSNLLWQGGEAPYGILRVPPGEIGIHRIGLQITGIANSTISQMNVFKLPLGADAAAMDLDAPNMPSRPVAEWVPQLLERIRADSAVNQERDGFFTDFLSNSSSPSCPLRRFAFYSSARPSFAPSMPSPQRAHHLFRAITGQAYAHPTMSQVTSGEYFGRYSTVNGFCFCPRVEGNPQTQCQVPIGAASDTCSLTQTVLALLGGTEPVTSHVFPPYTSLKQELPCRMQLDWPRVPIQLRDGSPGPKSEEAFRTASDKTNKQCHVLDRFRPFQYRYTSVPEFPSPGAPSSVRGACQTRRVAQVTRTVLDAVGGRRCVRESLAADQTLIRCAGSTARVAVPRPAPLGPPGTVLKAKTGRRSRCSQCSPPPRFQTNGGSPMAPESSFGRPFRLSAERMMARDLREAVCGKGQACPLLNRTAWRAGEFMRNFLLRPHILFVNATAPSSRQAPPAPVDDSANWTNHGWVYCPDRTSLVSGQGCRGSIPRDVWRSSKTTVCPRLVRALSSNGSRGGMTTVPFFQIDNYTQALDKAYGDARQLVGLANCIAAGNFTCLPKPWVYHPASFVPSNMEWAYQTVLEYYRLVNISACPMTQDELKLVELNQKFMQDCPANTLRLFQNILAIVRLVGTTLAFIVSTLFSMAFKLITLLFAGAETGLKNSVRVAQQELAADWLWIKNQARGMLSGINRLLLDMLFTTGQIGKVLLNFLTSICERING